MDADWLVQQLLSSSAYLVASGCSYSRLGGSGNRQICSEIPDSVDDIMDSLMSMYPESSLVGSSQYSSNSEPSLLGRQALSKVWGEEKGSGMSPETAYSTLDVPRDVDEAMLLTIYSIRVKNQPSQAERMREALSVISKLTNSERLRQFLATAADPPSYADDREGSNMLPICDDDWEDDDTAYEVLRKSELERTSTVHEEDASPPAQGCEVPDDVSAADVIISITGLVFCELGYTSLVPALPKSLTGVMAMLHVNNIIHELPTCPACLRVHPESKPRLRSPFKTITEQLASILAVPGNEDLVNAWKLLPRFLGRLRDIFDGAVCHRVHGPDGKPFFKYDPLEDDGPDGELRIGLALGLDCLIAASYTSCPMSFMIVNFPASLRFRASNLLLSGIIPGPKETDPDQTQYYLRILVNELLRLWYVGVVIKTPRFPNGRRVRVILVGVFCDKPAAHKVGGFGSHMHNYFCTVDWITKVALSTADAFIRNARTNDEHRANMAAYQSQTSKKGRDEFVKARATRWSELAQLPYFNMCDMIVIDPMHNLFLGLVKTHFYIIWVQLKILRKTKELSTFHDMLKMFTVPSKLGRLPHLVGEPAGGSLTSDQWMLLAIIIAPMLLPQLWAECEPDPNAKAIKGSNASLSSFSGIIIQAAVKAGGKEKPETGSNEKAKGWTASAAPTFFTTSLAYYTMDGDFVLNFGPLREFWTFVFERLNKILKSFKTNNHDGGELECTFLREFHRTAELYRLLAEGLRNAPSECVREGCRQMVHASIDIRGTVQQFAQDIEDTYIDGGIALQLSPRATNECFELELYSNFVQFLRRTHPLQPYHTVLEPHPPAGSLLISDRATFFDYAVICSHRYVAASRSTSVTARDSLALVRTSGPTDAARTWVAEVHHIFSSQSPAHLLVSVKWLRPVPLEILSTSPWGPFAEDFDLRLWYTDSYLQSTDTGPAVRHTVTLGGTQKFWLTLPIHEIPPTFSPTSDISSS
ncbi:hypothetical protein L227DRAFT_562043 [Lentinus tigrinus ALCF2SS1-6]|uniref:UCH repeated domain-containing protein n=1 Tax=Lentinus tigrinus ALCF2SS1-6 TaxID=1328759 RepID=A0A5C2SG35_9APHY|nr:hypothetical protein L227DRAFT_562043 [Lentinus tigrinus ALCF2SS1-6]